MGTSSKLGVARRSFTTWLSGFSAASLAIRALLTMLSLRSKPRAILRPLDILGLLTHALRRVGGLSAEPPPPYENYYEMIAQSGGIQRRPELAQLVASHLAWHSRNTKRNGGSAKLPSRKARWSVAEGNALWCRSTGHRICITTSDWRWMAC